MAVEIAERDKCKSGHGLSSAPAVKLRRVLEADARGELHSPVVRDEVAELVRLKLTILVGIDRSIVERHRRNARRNVKGGVCKERNVAPG